jgi:hypothetical protein
VIEKPLTYKINEPNGFVVAVKAEYVMDMASQTCKSHI